MYDSNVLGTMRMTRALLPKLEASGQGHIVDIGSIAGLRGLPRRRGLHRRQARRTGRDRDPAPGTARQADRVTEIAPGLVETEFSLVRFGGDAERAQTSPTRA